MEKEHRNLIKEINFFEQCKRYGIQLWQCPSFLFMLMGVLIIFSSLGTWIIGSRLIENQLYIALIVLFLAAFLFVVTFVITKSFENLAEANKIKSDFINIISHQLRSPLSNLNWVLELLMSESSKIQDKKYLDYLKILEENSKRMSELVSDLLIVSRIESSGLSDKKEEVSLLDLVKNVVSDFKDFAKVANIEIDIKTQENLPRVFANTDQLRQAIKNLVDNSIKYIKNKGKVVITLSKDKNNILFEIEDNGVGIPLGEQKYVFQKFFRSKNILKYQTQGSGLGLYIVKAVIEKAGGKVGFKSEENKGSKFWFTLPLKNK